MSEWREFEVCCSTNEMYAMEISADRKCIAHCSFLVVLSSF